MRWRQATREERQLGMLWGAAALATLLLRPFWLAIAALLPACPFRTITGIPCPSCGTTHAVVALLHGSVGDALRASPLAALAAGGFLVGGLLAPLWSLARWPAPDIPVPLPFRLRVAIVAVGLAGWAWVVATAR